MYGDRHAMTMLGNTARVRDCKGGPPQGAWRIPRRAGRAQNGRQSAAAGPVCYGAALMDPSATSRSHRRAGHRRWRGRRPAALAVLVARRARAPPAGARSRPPTSRAAASRRPGARVELDEADADAVEPEAGRRPARARAARRPRSPRTCPSARAPRSCPSPGRARPIASCRSTSRPPRPPAGSSSGRRGAGARAGQDPRRLGRAPRPALHRPQGDRSRPWSTSWRRCC